MDADALVRKVRSQATRLVEQQQSLMVALAYGQLCERRLLQLAPEHSLPLTAEMVEAAGREDALAPAVAQAAAMQADLAAALRRAEVAESESDALLRAHAGGGESGGGGGGGGAKQHEATRAARAPKTRDAPAAAGSVAAARRNPVSIESLRVERAQLQRALRTARDEIDELKRVAFREAAEARKALEEAGRAMGLPSGAAAILKQHASSERRMGELSAALSESERHAKEGASAAAEARAALEASKAEGAKVLDEISTLRAQLGQSSERADAAERRAAVAEEACAEEGTNRAAVRARPVASPLRSRTCAAQPAPVPTPRRPCVAIAQLVRVRACPTPTSRLTLRARSPAARTPARPSLPHPTSFPTVPHRLAASPPCASPPGRHTTLPCASLWRATSSCSRRLSGRPPG